MSLSHSIMVKTHRIVVMTMMMLSVSMMMAHVVSRTIVLPIVMLVFVMTFHDFLFSTFVST
jgi:hypothetical protein